MANTRTTITDGYDTWYAEKLWRLLPAVYRTRDVASGSGSVGPLREMVNRIGAQVAVVRRSTDRLWENESIETCDDWVIPYIGDLLATRIIAFADTRAQRLDVAKTIYYRQHAGTLGLLEELAADVAGRDAHVVEFFRRLGRTRHQLDPQIGVGGSPIGIPTDPTDLTALPVPMVEGLVGRFSRTPAGGFADLRNVYGGANAGTAFDEFSYTADLRRGAQSNGWYNISHLGVFVWWLQSFPIASATPCAAVGTACPGRFTFDPTGRQIPLFVQPTRNSAASFGENWVTPDEWDLPVAIRQVLFNEVPDELYPGSLSVSLGGDGVSSQIPETQLNVFPEQGLFNLMGLAPTSPLVVSYHFGFLSEIGAGGFDASTLLESLSIPASASVAVVAGGENPAPPPVPPGAVLLSIGLPFAPITAPLTVEIADSLTYQGPTTTTVDGTTLVVVASAPQRPVFRWPGAEPATWTIQGGGPKSVLVLQGILLQGADLVLTGAFDTVYLRLMTLDPGTSSASSVTPPNQIEQLAPLPSFGIAIDGTPLRPTTLYVEGTIGSLVVERCITGPIRTRNGGAIETLTASDSILQAIQTHALGAGPIVDPTDLAARLKNAPSTDTLAPLILAAGAGSSPSLATQLMTYMAGTIPSAALVQSLTTAIDALPLSERQEAEAAYPLSFADLALGLSSGTVSLTQCTVLGQSATHRMAASESIFDDVAVVDDTQHGCVRFSAYAQNSNLHQPFRSVAVPAIPPLFVSRNFGEPEYARLRRDADAAILSSQPGDTILGGAEDGSEMGAFSSEQIALKKRGLTLKLVEFMPLGVQPVWIDAD